MAQVEPLHAMQFQAIAPGVFVRTGKPELAHPDNGGAVGASLLLCGQHRILWVDPGPTAELGRQMTPAVHRLCASVLVTEAQAAASSPAALSQRPLDLAVTRASPEIALAASGIAHRHFMSTRAIAAAMAERCPKCLEQLTETLGAHAMTDTRIIVPQQSVADGQSAQPGLSLGDTDSSSSAPNRNVTGIQPTDTRWHTPMRDTEQAGLELALVDEQAGWLYAPSLVFAQSWPRLAELDLDTWIATLQRWSARAWRTVISADAVTHMVAAGAGPIAQTLQDLRRLREDIDRDLRQGGDVATIDRRLLFADQQHRPLFAQRHGRLMQGLARQRELKLFDE